MIEEIDLAFSPMYYCALKQHTWGLRHRTVEKSLALHVANASSIPNSTHDAQVVQPPAPTPIPKAQVQYQGVWSLPVF